MNTIRSFALSLLLLPALVAGIQATPKPATPQAKEVEPDPVALMAMRSKVLRVHYRDPFQLTRSLEALGSGSPGARLSWNKLDDLNTITVRDFPENVAAIEEALKRLDVPTQTQKAPDVILTIHVLFASRQPMTEPQLPGELDGVIKSLRTTLGFKGYTLAASLSQRVGVNGDRTIQGRGQIDGALLGLGSTKEPSTLNMDWESDRGVAMDSSASGAATYALRKFQFWLRERDDRTLAKLETGITLKEGEKIVVGSSVVKDRGVIVVLTLQKAE